MYMVYFYIVVLDAFFGSLLLIFTFLYIISNMYTAYYVYICSIKQYYESFHPYSYT